MREIKRALFSRLVAAFPATTTFALSVDQMAAPDTPFVKVVWSGEPRASEVREALGLPHNAIITDRRLPVAAIERVVAAVFWMFDPAAVRLPLTQRKGEASLGGTMPFGYTVLPYDGRTAAEVLDDVASGAPVPPMRFDDLGEWLASPFAEVRLAGLRAAATVPATSEPPTECSPADVRAKECSSC